MTDDVEILGVLINRVFSEGICNEYTPEGKVRRPWTYESLEAASTVSRKTLRSWRSGASFSPGRLQTFCDRLAKHRKIPGLSEDEYEVLEQLRKLAGKRSGELTSLTNPHSEPKVIWSVRTLTIGLVVLLFVIIPAGYAGWLVLPGGEEFPTFKDCGNCPVMTNVPEGVFRAGSPIGERFRDPDEGLIGPILVRSFAVSVKEISNGEFEFFLRQSGYRQTEPCQKIIKDGGWFELPNFEDNIQDPNWPEGCISFDDALAYVDWINSLVEGEPYRIPTQIEWEYLARAGTTTAYFWGDDLGESCKYANPADQSALKSFPGWDEVVPCDDGEDDGSSAGAQYLPNDFGLYDTIGSLIEVTAGCHDMASYSAGMARTLVGDIRNCAKVYVRGGGWGTPPSDARVADFRYFARNLRHQQHGLRVVRDLYGQTESK